MIFTNQKILHKNINVFGVWCYVVNRFTNFVNLIDLAKNTPIESK